MSSKPKTVRVPKFKSNIKVLDSSALQGVCSCGWTGNALAQSAGLALAMAGVQSEIQGHKHMPQPKKIRKTKEK